MSKDTTIIIVASVAGLVSLVAWAMFILVPAWSSYPRTRERLVAAVLSLYVLAAMVVLGGLVGAGVLYFYDEL